VIPERYRVYPCGDYFGSPQFTRGYFDEEAQFTTFYAAADVVEYPALGFLAIGGPGVDGIEWGYRCGESGLWAYYPITSEFVYLAPTVAALFEGWSSGRINV